MDAESFNAHGQNRGIYKDVAEDVETRLNNLNFELDRPLSKGKNEKVIGLTKDKLDGQIMKEFIQLGAKRYSYLEKNNNEDKKQKVQKACHKKKT